MSIGTTSHGILWIAVALCCGGAREPPSSCDPGAQPRSALLIIENHTSCPVYLYVNGRFVARCEPCLKLKVYTTVYGDVSLVGRSLCDTWGPQNVRLAPGRTTTWRLGASNRHRPPSRSVGRTSNSCGNPDQNILMMSW
ncbi:MAG: hypothetical protein ACE5E1_07855 [Phycisphaerae bacterium]